MLLRSLLRVRAPQEPGLVQHPKVGAPQEARSVLLRSRSQGRLLPRAAPRPPPYTISHHPTQRQFQGFLGGGGGGAWLGLYGLGSHYIGTHGCSSARIVTKSSPKPIAEVTQGCPKKEKIRNLACVTK